MFIYVKMIYNLNLRIDRRMMPIPYLSDLDALYCVSIVRLAWSQQIDVRDIRRSVKSESLIIVRSQVRIQMDARRYVSWMIVDRIATSTRTK